MVNVIAGDSRTKNPFLSRDQSNGQGAAAEAAELPMPPATR